jgi:uncharacterized protein (DUF2345 family)
VDQFFNVAAPVVLEQAVTPGTTPVMLANGAARTLAAGRYADVVVQARSRLVLGAGTYELASLTVEGDATVVLDTSAGPITLLSEGNVTLHARANFEAGSPADVTLYSNGSDVRVYDGVEFPGSITAPHAYFELAANTVVDGCIAGERVFVGPGSLIRGR